MRFEWIVFSFSLILLLIGCGNQKQSSNDEGKKTMTFQEDVAFLKKHADAVVLTDGSGPAIVVVPAYQGRVMTSAFDQNEPGIGWINYDLIASGKKRPQINPYGGEERLWLGPEGGPYALFFDQGKPFTLEHWRVPPLLDTEPFDLVTWTEISVTLTKTASLVNYAGTVFDFRIDRTVRFLSPGTIGTILGVQIPDGVRGVAYETENSITNLGQEAWTKKGGLLSLWILGMYKATPTTTAILPFREGPEEELGPIVNDAYFGKVPADRLKIHEGLILFKADGQYRSKIGVSPRRAMRALGSYDPARKLLTIVTIDVPRGDYVNSMWEMQDDPYAGDVVNAYNDGPQGDGKPGLGAFFELETSSPAAELEPGRTLTHYQRTFHFTGEEADLQKIAEAILGADLRAVANAFAGTSQPR
ncbi:MAG: hypothetical protein KatS3mg015_0345 [Fimbriimonadales bacterium]|nr:MAG: hypothetical protein KatS3mg015_0345 [Fimbriimonadales bacterium]